MAGRADSTEHQPPLLPIALQVQRRSVAIDYLLPGAAVGSQPGLNPLDHLGRSVTGQTIAIGCRYFGPFDPLLLDGHDQRLQSLRTGQQPPQHVVPRGWPQPPPVIDQKLAHAGINGRQHRTAAT